MPIRGHTVSIDVLIAGGGSVGLMLAVLLRHHGVTPLVVEEKPELSPHPRATGIGSRSMEILREVGLEHAVDEAAVGLRAGKISGRTLAEADFTEGTEWKRKTAAEPTYTPARIRGTCAQNRLDRVLITKAGDVEFGVALDSFEQDPGGVTATLSDGRVVRARYLVAADGVRSRVRQILGIGLTGPGVIGQETTSVLFGAHPHRARRPLDRGGDPRCAEVPGTRAGSRSVFRRAGLPGGRRGTRHPPTGRVRVERRHVAHGVSTLDLVGSKWCVVTADPGVKADVPVHVVDGWPYGTVLVRPDGFVSRSYRQPTPAVAARAVRSG